MISKAAFDTKNVSHIAKNFFQCILIIFGLTLAYIYWTPPGECSDDQVPPAVAAAPRPQIPYIREREAANGWAPACQRPSKPGIWLFINPINSLNKYYIHKFLKEIKITNIN